MTNSDKDIRFTEKKVDDNWKRQAKPEEVSNQEVPVSPPPKVNKAAPAQTLKPFMNLVTSLGLQGLMQLGEIPNPEDNQPHTDLAAAKEIIDLLVALEKKVAGNTSQEESNLLTSLISELQLKFSSHV